MSSRLSILRHLIPSNIGIRVKVVRVAARVGYGDYKRQFFLDYECHVVRKTRQIDAPVTSGTEPPEKWMLNNGRADALGFGAESRAKASGAGLIVARDTLRLGCRLWQELQNKAHLYGAICRSLAKTSPAVIGFDSPALKRAIRRRDLGLPGRLRAGIRLQIHALQELASER